MNDTILIFDFDGTIADTHHHIIKISNQLAEEFGYSVIKPDEIEELKDKSSREVIRYLKVPIFKIPAILARAKKALYDGMAEIDPIEGLKEILQKLKDLDSRMGILSSNAPENINKFLANHDLEVFEFVDSTLKVWTKNISLKKLLERHGFLPKQILYIGDETRDIEAAKALGIKVAAVTWGYNSATALKKHDPDFLIHTPQELFELCTNHH